MALEDARKRWTLVKDAMRLETSDQTKSIRNGILNHNPHLCAHCQRVIHHGQKFVIHHAAPGLLSDLVREFIVSEELNIWEVGLGWEEWGKCNWNPHSRWSLVGLSQTNEEKRLLSERWREFHRDKATLVPMHRGCHDKTRDHATLHTKARKEYLVAFILIGRKHRPKRHTLDSP